jgi:hypothetical protein
MQPMLEYQYLSSWKESKDKKEIEMIRKIFTLHIFSAVRLRHY